MSSPDTDQEFADALRFAGEEARRYGATMIGTEHLLLGVLRQETAPVAELLASRGLSLQRVRDQFELMMGPSFHRARTSGAPGAGALQQLTPRAARMLAAVGERRDLAHLLHAILAERGVGFGLLEACGTADLTEVEAELGRMLTE